MPPCRACPRPNWPCQNGSPCQVLSWPHTVLSWQPAQQHDFDMSIWLQTRNSPCFFCNSDSHRSPYVLRLSYQTLARHERICCAKAFNDRFKFSAISSKNEAALHHIGGIGVSLAMQIHSTPAKNNPPQVRHASCAQVMAKSSWSGRIAPEAEADKTVCCAVNLCLNQMPDLCLE